MLLLGVVACWGVASHSTLPEGAREAMDALLVSGGEGTD